MRLLLFIGAGTSTELGVPAMREMATQFRQHLYESGSGGSILSIIDNRIKDDMYDIENLIEELDRLDEGFLTAHQWGTSIEGSFPKGVNAVRMEAEWFVQHVCERVQSTKAYRLWSATLRNLKSHDATIGTTNYDRGIELASAPMGIRISDGFEDFGENEWGAWKGFHDTGGIRLLKVHGSTDWYHSLEGESVWKLRHAMPLFGKASLYVDHPELLRLRHAAVLPSREKKVTQVPYPSLMYELRKAAAEAEIAIFLGTSLRDPDLRSLCKECSDKIPTFVVSRSAIHGSSYVPVSAKVLQQSASVFLVSILPSGLRSATVSELVQYLESATPRRESILEWLVTALDEGEAAMDRCKAIDALSNIRVCLEGDEVESLLKSSASDVRRYALAFIVDSIDRGYLMGVAQSIAANGSDVEFQKEVELLSKLMSG